MKKITLMALSMLVLNVNAQYFQHTYGPHSTGESGKNITALPSPGHVISGRFCHVVYTDETGNFPTMPPINDYFNNYYTFSSGGNVQTSLDDHVFEFNNGSGFGVAGWIGTGNSVYYLKLHPNGTPMTGTAFEYTLPSPFQVVSVVAIEESASGNEVYIAGWAQAIQSGPLYVASFILKIDVSTGALIWSHFYNNSFGTTASSDYISDIMESPFNGELVAIGNIHQSSPTADDNYLIKINSSNGNPLTTTSTSFSSSSGSNIYLNSISVCNSNLGGTPGFMLAGTKEMGGGDYDIALIRINSLVGIIWSYTYDYSLSAGDAQFAMDVIERQNMAGNYEYYVGGTVTPGIFGNFDALVLKADENGNGVSEFTYGTASDQESFMQLDFNNLPPGEGLSMYGTKAPATGPLEKYFVKAYFNGITGCNYDTATPTAVSDSISKVFPTISKFMSFGTDQLDVSSYAGTDSVICDTMSDPNGKNDFVLPPKSLMDEAGIAPNPMPVGTPIATVMVNLETENTEKVDVTIYDMLGRQYYTSHFMLVKGRNQLPLDLSKAHMPAGMYMVKLAGEHLNKSIVLIVK